MPSIVSKISPATIHQTAVDTSLLITGHKIANLRAKILQAVKKHTTPHVSIFNPPQLCLIHHTPASRGESLSRLIHGHRCHLAVRCFLTLCYQECEDVPDQIWHCQTDSLAWYFIAHAHDQSTAAGEYSYDPDQFGWIQYFRFLALECLVFRELCGFDYSTEMSGRVQCITCYFESQPRHLNALVTLGEELLGENRTPSREGLWLEQLSMINEALTYAGWLERVIFQQKPWPTQAKEPELGANTACSIPENSTGEGKPEGGNITLVSDRVASSDYFASEGELEALDSSVSSDKNVEKTLEDGHVDDDSNDEKGDELEDKDKLECDDICDDFVEEECGLPKWY